MTIIGLPALVGRYDNLIWILYQNDKAWVIDPGESADVSAFLQENHLTLERILITHDHSDHINGVAQLIQSYPNVTLCGPKSAQLSELNPHYQTLKEGDQLEFDAQWSLSVLETPGHTQNHISFYNEYALFCGDTLFSGGAGRLLGGTPEQFSASILKLRDLPTSLNFYSAHEYTLDNLHFAALVEPNNLALKQRLATTQIDYPTVYTHPQSTLELEIATNPFMRFDSSEIKPQLLQRGAQDHPASLFATLRAWKDQFDATQ
jgi:hydroxyacylglutathione hydrolase